MRPFLLAAALLVVPAVAGFVVGRLLGRRRAFAAVASLAIVAASLAAVPLLQDVGAWDLIEIGSLAAGSLLLGTARAGGRDLRVGIGLAVAAVTVVLAGAEVALRLAGAGTPAFPPPSEARLAFNPAEREAACRLMYPGSSGGDLGTRLDVAPAGVPAVVHLGDSMIGHTDVEGGDPFATVLGRLQPGVWHVPVEAAGTGTDAQYLMARGVLGDRRADLLVLYVFSGNDLEDMDRSYACCPDGPVLAYDGNRVAGPRCATPAWDFPVRHLFARSPPPFPWRIATSFSVLARVACDALSRASLGLEMPLGLGGTVQGSELQWAHFEASVAALRDFLARRGTSFLAVVLPYRRALESPDPAASPAGLVATRAEATLDRLGVRRLDATPVLAAAMAQTRVFANQTPDDAHLSPAGHEVLARWLEPTISKALEGW